MLLNVHQALHGYSDGHRLIASSISLSPRDARLMLVMSDASGPGVTTFGNPYITGYPLTESGMYVIASTWPAPEMSRPGCVWTHSVLITFADLARMESPSVLVEMLSPPSMHARSSYENEVQVQVGLGRRPPLNPPARHFAAMLASALYEQPQKQVWARSSSHVAADDVVLRLWDQQWPKLRRSFKFCTLTTKDRSIDELQFDLQLTPAQGSNVRLRFSSAAEDIEAVEISDGAWLESLLDDLSSTGERPLKQLLRQVGTEILGGRESMRPMTILHSLLQGGYAHASPQGIAVAVSLAEGEPQLAQSRSAKTAVMKAALSASVFFPLADEVREFVLVNYQLLSEEEATQNAPVLARLVWRSSPRAYVVASYEGSKKVQVALHQCVSSIEREAVFDALAKLTDLAEPLLHLRPDLAQDQRFWAQTQSWPSSVASMGVDVRSPAAVNAMVAGLHDLGAINSAIHLVGARAVLAALEDLISSASTVKGIESWVRQACNDVSGIANFLSHERQSTELLLHLAHALPPDAIPNDYGDDPWYIALSHSRAMNGPLPVELSAYGFRRAFSWRCRSVEPLLQLTFEPLHQAALRQAVPSQSWQLLEGTLPWTPASDAWDTALRLRRAVAKKCVDFPVRPDSFVSLVSSPELFHGLMNAVWDLWNGPRYIRSVKDWLDHAKDESLANARKAVRKLVKDRSKLW